MGFRKIIFPLITKGSIFIHPPQKSDRNKKGLIFFVPIFPVWKLISAKNGNSFSYQISPPQKKKTYENGHRMTQYFFRFPRCLFWRHRASELEKLEGPNLAENLLHEIFYKMGPGSLRSKQMAQIPKW